MAFPISLRLAVRQWAARPLRPILCSLAIAAAVALIICVGAAMDSLRFSLSKSIGEILGVAEVHVRPAQKETDARVGQSVLQQIRSLPEVELIDGRLAGHASLTSAPATGSASGEAETHWYDVIGIDPVLDETLRPKKYVSKAHDGLAVDEIMVDALVAEQLHLKLGDKVPYSVDGDKTRTVTVAAILHSPSLELLAKPTLYVPIDGLMKDMGVDHEYSVLDIKLKDNAGIDDYDAYAKTLGKALGPSVEAMAGTTSRAKLSEMTRTVDLMLLILSIMSGFCAAMIIGTTLSVGVQERVRQFGQLRCLGASRGQLAVFLLADAAVMMAIGEALGVVLGLALSAALVAWLPQFFIAYQVSPASLLIAVFCGAFATMLGAAIPIWQITRVPPMAAVAAVARRPQPRYVFLAAAFGAACLLIQLALWNLLPGREARFFTYVILGIPMIFAGWSLLAPACVVLLERPAALVLGKLLGVHPALLRNVWSRTPWRAGAMIAALMIGVTFFTAVRARGDSIQASYVSPAHIPDLIVKYVGAGAGLNETRLDFLRKAVPEMREVAVLDYKDVKMDQGAFQLGSLLNQPDTTFIAVEPESFAKFVDLEYIQGDPRTSIALLKQGGYVFISKEFHNVRNLGVGDTVAIMGFEGKPVDFKIAAVVTSTGIDLVKNFFDLRTGFNDKSISSVLGTIDDARKYFKLKDPTLALINLAPEAAKAGPATEARKKLEAQGLMAVSSLELKTSIGEVLGRVINGLSVIAIGALCVASLGVANMVIAAIHAKRFEFGVLRAIGAGRGQLLRLVLAEVSLIGLTAGILGWLAGLHFAYMATRIDMLVVGFPTSFLALNFADALLAAALLLGIAVLLTVLLAWLASLVPAIRGVMQAQRTLLASGRG